MAPRNIAFLLVAALLIAGLATVPAAAQETGPEQGDNEADDSPVIDIDLESVEDALDDLSEAFEEFSGSWTEDLGNVLTTTFFTPFLVLLKQLITDVAQLLTHTPTVYPNTAVEEIHRETLLVTYSLSGLAFAAVGLLYMIGPVLGVSYSQVNQILPRVLLALVFATVAPQLLQYAVDLTNVLTLAFEPDAMTTSIREIGGVTASLVLVWFINATLLLAVVAMFVLRGIYILFTVAISPLIALAWALPMTKKYADTFIAGFWTALVMAPLDMLILKFCFALLHSTDASAMQRLSNWVFGVACFSLLLLVPYQLYGASQIGLGGAYSVAGSVKRRIRRSKMANRRQEDRQQKLRTLRQQNHNRRSRDRLYRGDDDD